MPKSYKKFISKNNDYNNIKNNQRTLDNKFTNRENNFDNNNDFNKNQNHHQVHKLKKTYNSYSNWICNDCNYLNRGYRKFLLILVIIDIYNYFLAQSPIPIDF